MTSEGFSPTAVDKAIRQARCLLMGFDGPICTLFAGTPADSAADLLRAEIKEAGIPLPQSVEDTPDPLDILRFAASLDSDLASRVEARLTELELTAAATAPPAPYAHDVLAACRESGRTAAIISANSSAAIHAYLTAHDLTSQFAAVAARTGPDPLILPPSPHLIDQATIVLSAWPAECVVIASAPSGIQAAQAAGVPSIAYAKTPDDAGHQVRAGANAVVYSMADIALRLRTRTVD
jgi:phosphoglycolate phosphatase